MHNTDTTAEARKKLAGIVNTLLYGKAPIVLQARRGRQVAVFIAMPGRIAPVS